jgi:aryl-alcohol dehydrogenase-like predicted oxidoreductase
MKRRKFIGTVTAASMASITGVQASTYTFSGKQKQSTKPLMPTRTLGKTGAEVSVLALGGVVALAEKPNAHLHPAELANAALDAGINYFDTSHGYGNGQSERNFGEVLAKRRKEVFIATKTGERTYDGAMRDVEESLERLQTDQLDLLQIHSITDDEDITKWDAPDGVLKAFHKLRDEKVIRFIGVTGHETAESVCRAIDIYDFDTVLTTFNPVARRLSFEQQVIPLAQNKNMGILAMKLMGGGYGSLVKGNPAKNNEIRWYYDQAPRQAEASTLIRFVLGLPITSAVIGMGSFQQLRTNVEAAKEMQPLNDQERKKIMRQML